MSAQSSRDVGSIHVDRSHVIRIDRPIEAAFPLFTPIGETVWVPDWRPVFVHPSDGTTAEGMVFLTDFDGEDTIWACVHFRPEAHEVGYVRVTPGSRVAMVDVAARSIDAATSEVTVRYRITALSPAGEAVVAAFGAAAFAERIEGWRERIAALPV